MGVCQATINRLCCVTTTREARVTDQGQANRQRPPQPKTNVLTNHYQSHMSGYLCDASLSRHIISLDDLGGVKNIYLGDMHSREEFSFLMNLASWCSEQMDDPGPIDVIMNVMPPIVFCTTIVSVVVVSWCKHGFTMIVVLPW